LDQFFALMRADFKSVHEGIVARNKATEAQRKSRKRWPERTDQLSRGDCELLALVFYSLRLCVALAGTCETPKRFVSTVPLRLVCALFEWLSLRAAKATHSARDR